MAAGQVELSLRHGVHLVQIVAAGKVDHDIHVRDEFMQQLRLVQDIAKVRLGGGGLGGAVEGCLVLGARPACECMDGHQPQRRQEGPRVCWLQE